MMASVTSRLEGQVNESKRDIGDESECCGRRERQMLMVMVREGYTLQPDEKGRKSVKPTFKL